MRLLKVASAVEDDAKLELEEFVWECRPKYAILSHTWSQEKDYEVLFSDIVNGTAHKRKGFAKVQSAARQAHKDGHQYIWQDTCCIDKSSSAELQEAINSMFKWYKNAEVCYAYLADVTTAPTPEDPGSKQQAHFETHFANSRWFTRGWTLQELLAPETLEFFSKEWEGLGSRTILCEDVEKITGINRHFLQPSDYYLDWYPDLYPYRKKIEKATVAERMSWASRRHTTREEDIAYCLMGIFDVNMPLLYGEGNKAFLRLQEEIMKRSADQSIFAWTYSRAGKLPEIDPLLGSPYNGLLAATPEWFSEGRGIFVGNLDDLPETAPYSTTNRGLQLQMRLRPLGDGFFQASTGQIGLFLKKSRLGKNQYARAFPDRLCCTEACEAMPFSAVFVRQEVNFLDFWDNVMCYHIQIRATAVTERQFQAVTLLMLRDDVINDIVPTAVSWRELAKQKIDLYSATTVGLLLSSTAHPRNLVFTLRELEVDFVGFSCCLASKINSLRSGTFPVHKVLRDLQQSSQLQVPGTTIRIPPQEPQFLVRVDVLDVERSGPWAKTYTLQISIEDIPRTVSLLDWIELD